MSEVVELIGYFIAFLIAFALTIFYGIKICRQIKIRRSYSGNHLEISTPDIIKENTKF